MNNNNRENSLIIKALSESVGELSLSANEKWNMIHTIGVLLERIEFLAKGIK